MQVPVQLTSARNYFWSCDRSRGTNFVATRSRSTDKISEPKSVESPDLLILILSIADFRRWQLERVQHFRIFCLLKTFPNVDNFQWILDHL